MNRRTTSTRTPRHGLSRAAAMVVGAMLCAAPLASASAANVDGHVASSEHDGSMDLRIALAVEQRRIALGLMAWMGGGLETAAHRVSTAHGALATVVTFGLEMDSSEATEDAPEDPAEEERADEEESDVDDTDEDNAEDDSEPTSRRFDYAEDTNDPLAGL